ncbi:hypothetical protein DAPPUDRAFT_326343 [Daphnia pulex]|uniref:Uncharacterized protein n=1 Tax=Daphnia pulex TaxID=6669 RepID=E9H7F7_DAPPU|nr:hypothetical protein DAPPUDRAFT_326343 [Daphnia pulex]|eukprot:EFX72369.1 hypothetical protein DAPPUDRAFT_326343 [Daphnia pulex]
MKSRFLLGFKKGGTRTDEIYVVSVHIDDVSDGHHDVHCQNPNEQSYIESIQQLINPSQTNQEPHSARDDGDNEARAEYTLEFTEAACSTATETASEEEEVIGNFSVDNDAVDTDDDIWSGKRSQERKQIYSVASVRLLEIITQIAHCSPIDAQNTSL